VSNRKKKVPKTGKKEENFLEAEACGCENVEGMRK
jgi:hypothetical protein